MTTRDDLERDRNDPTSDERPDEASGDVLGISRVPVGGTGEIRPQRGSNPQSSHVHADDEERITPLEDERDLGARDVTNTGHGETGPETGGHGSTPRRSGATGSDIGS